MGNTPSNSNTIASTRQVKTVVHRENSQHAVINSKDLQSLKNIPTHLPLKATAIVSNTNTTIIKGNNNNNNNNILTTNYTNASSSSSRTKTKTTKTTKTTTTNLRSPPSSASSQTSTNESSKKSRSNKDISPTTMPRLRANGLLRLYCDVRNHFNHLGIACNREQVKIESSIAQCDERMKHVEKNMNEYCRSLNEMSKSIFALKDITNRIQELTNSLSNAIDYCDQLQLLLPENHKKRISPFHFDDEESRVIFRGDLFRKESVFGSVLSRNYLLTRDGLLFSYSKRNANELRTVIDLKHATEVVANGMTGLSITVRNKRTQSSETWNFTCTSEYEVSDWLVNIQSLEFNKDRSKQLTYLNAPTNYLMDNLTIVFGNIPNPRITLVIREKWIQIESIKKSELPINNKNIPLPTSSNCDRDLLLYSNNNELRLYCIQKVEEEEEDTETLIKSTGSKIVCICKDMITSLACDTSNGIIYVSTKTSVYSFSWNELHYYIEEKEEDEKIQSRIKNLSEPKNDVLITLNEVILKANYRAGRMYSLDATSNNSLERSSIPKDSFIFGEISYMTFVNVKSLIPCLLIADIKNDLVLAYHINKGFCNILCRVTKPSSLCYNSDNMSVYIGSMECGVYCMYISKVFMDNLFVNSGGSISSTNYKNIEMSGTLFALNSSIHSSISSISNSSDGGTTVPSVVGSCRQMHVLEDNRILTVLCVTGNYLLLLDSLSNLYLVNASTAMEDRNSQRRNSNKNFKKRKLQNMVTYVGKLNGAMNVYYCDWTDYLYIAIPQSRNIQQLYGLRKHLISPSNENKESITKPSKKNIEVLNNGSSDAAVKTDTNQPNIYATTNPFNSRPLKEDWRDRGESLYDIPQEELFFSKAGNVNVKNVKQEEKQNEEEKKKEENQKTWDEITAQHQRQQEREKKRKHLPSNPETTNEKNLSDTTQNRSILSIPDNTFANASDNTNTSNIGQHVSPSASYTSSPYSHSSGSSVPSSPQAQHNRNHSSATRTTAKGTHSPAIVVAPRVNAGTGIGMKGSRPKHKHKKNKKHIHKDMEETDPREVITLEEKSSAGTISPPSTIDNPKKKVRSNIHLPGSIPDIPEYYNNEINSHENIKKIKEEEIGNNTNQLSKRVCFPKSLFLVYENKETNQRKILAEIRDILQDYMLSDIRARTDKTLPKHLRNYSFLYLYNHLFQQDGAYRPLNKDYESSIPALNLIQNFSNGWSILVTLDDDISENTVPSDDQN